MHEKMEEKKGIKLKIPKLNVWLISTVILSVLLVFSLFKPLKMTGRITGEANVLSPEEVESKVMDFINSNLVRPGTKAESISVEEESGVYKITTSYLGQRIVVYASKDGNILFLNAVDISKPPEKKEQPTQSSGFDAPDREKTNVKFFVMSFCPFGNQAESGLEPVYRLLKDKVEWEPHYVIYSNYGGYPSHCLDEEKRYCSMHGIQELNQDVRELCVWKYYSHDTFWDFVMKVNSQCNYRNADTCWEPIAREIGIDVDKIKRCQRDEAVNLLEAELQLNQKYGVRGSPTVFINDMEYRGSRSPEAYKQAICSGFINPPEECSQSLGAQSASSSGQC